MGKLVLVLVLWLSALSAWAQPVTIAALGDSLTQGYGLVARDGFVAQLQRWLDARGAEARVINAGVSGDTTAGGAARVDWTLTPQTDAMIVALGGNDLLRGIDPAASRKNLQRILDAAEAAGVPVLLVGLRAPPNYGPDYKAAFDAIYPDLAREYGALYVESFFRGLEDQAASRQALARFMQPDGIHPNADGVERIVDGLGPAVLDLVERAGAGRK